jgi:serine phosphatase RsbU (regulator of sigma subunit)
MSLPAELQWRLLPPLTFVTSRIAISGIVAPTAEVAGDSFDYAVNGDIAHVAVVDGMGHGLEAALLSAVAISALRNARRSDQGLTDSVQAMNDALESQFGPDKFVTGIVGQLDTCTGLWSWVTCGHPPALLLRHGRVVKTLDRAISPPLGLRTGDSVVSSERLEPGDRLVLYTDGVTEARDANGEFFGNDRLVDFVAREAAGGRPTPETLRRLNLAILAHQNGALQDDATTVIVEWHTDQAERNTP